VPKTIVVVMILFLVIYSEIYTKVTPSYEEYFNENIKIDPFN